MRPLTVLALLCFVSTATADDRDRRAKAALALAAAKSASSPIVAPMPRPAVPPTYPDAHAKAVENQRPLVVFVSCETVPVEGADVCQTKATTFGDVQGPAIVVCVPQGDRLTVDSKLPCPAKTADVNAAVKAAVKKMGAAKPVSLPAAPKPLDWQIRAEPKSCICGDACKCPAGACPGNCPVEPVRADGKPLTSAQKLVYNQPAVGGTPITGILPPGYRWENTAQGYGLRDDKGGWYLPPDPEYTARLDTGWLYTPMPAANPNPRGVWGSPCIKDSDCRVVECRIPAVGQHGQPTRADAAQIATAVGNSYHPNQFTSGYQRTLAGNCANGVCVPAQQVPVQQMPMQQPPAQPLRIVGYTQQKVCTPEGCRIVSVPVYR